MWTIFETEDLPPPERFAFWHELTNQSIFPMMMSLRTETTDFKAKLQVLKLGPAVVSKVVYPALAVHRTPKLIRDCDPETLQLSLPMRGNQGISQAGREVVVGHKDLMLADSSRPFDARTTTCADGTAETMIVQVARSLLPVPSNKLDSILARRLSGRDGIGALFLEFLTRVTSDVNQYQPTDMPRLGSVLLDLLTALLAHELDAGSTPEPHTQRQALTIRIQAFIQQHLADPALSPATIAAAHHISTSYLHKLSRDQGVTVSQQIRHARLERCRRDLADPHQRSRPVHAIAARWGFNDNASFSRTFRATYGIPPTDYRNLALSGTWRTRRRDETRLLGDHDRLQAAGQTQRGHNAIEMCLDGGAAAEAVAGAGNPAAIGAVGLRYGMITSGLPR